MWPRCVSRGLGRGTRVEPLPAAPVWASTLPASGTGFSRGETGDGVFGVIGQVCREMRMMTTYRLTSGLWIIPWIIIHLHFVALSAVADRLFLKIRSGTGPDIPHAPPPAPRDATPLLQGAPVLSGGGFLSSLSIFRLSDLKLILNKTLKRKHAATCVGMQSKAATVGASSKPDADPGAPPADHSKSVNQPIVNRASPPDGEPEEVPSGSGMGWSSPTPHSSSCA